MLDRLIERIWKRLKVKPGWKLEPPHAVCCNCQVEPERATAYNDAGEWYLHWYCDVCGMSPLDDEHMVEWPMRRNFARQPI